MHNVQVLNRLSRRVWLAGRHPGHQPAPDTTATRIHPMRARRRFTPLTAVLLVCLIGTLESAAAGTRTAGCNQSTPGNPVVASSLSLQELAGMRWSRPTALGRLAARPHLPNQEAASAPGLGPLSADELSLRVALYALPAGFDVSAATAALRARLAADTVAEATPDTTARAPRGS